MAVIERNAETLVATPRTQTKGQVAWRWMTTTDHKVIGNLYFITTMAFFMFGGVLALAMRAELAFPPIVPNQPQ
jgi:cytochrome c oxidase subunit 1